MVRKRRKTNLVLLVFGSLLVAASMFLLLHNSWEERVVGEETRGVKEVLEAMPADYDLEELAGKLEEGLIAIPDYVLDPEMEMPTVDVNGNAYCGTIKIPSRNIDLPVMPTWSYPKLKISPCIYVGSIYSNDAIIMAHNYKIHFRALWDMQPGEEVIFVDVDGNEFHYTVSWIEEIETDNHDQLMSKDPDWDLTLFTCTYSGTARCTLRCTLVDD